MEKIRIEVNGVQHDIQVEPWESLNHVLRERLRLTGTKKSCDSGGCGACTVIMNGEPIYSCMTYALKADGARILTIEELTKDGTLNPIQQAYVKLYALQCGYCTPGFIMSTKALLDKNPHPSEDEIKEALVGNLCRCTGYTKIMETVLSLIKSQVEAETSRDSTFPM
jgi:carbon-monoxide dehydrogenase small subunit